MNSCFLSYILAAPIGNPHIKGKGVEMPNVRKLIVIWLLLILALPLASIQAQDEQLANVARAHGDLNTIADLLEISGLAAEVDAAMSLTIFAPSDDAFAELPGFAIDYLSNNLELLQQILLYHVLPEAATSDSLPSGDIAGITGPLLSIQLDEMGVSVNVASVTEADIAVGNTVLHIIDRVLVPPIELPEVIPSFVDGSIIIAGSSTVFPLSDAIARAFATRVIQATSLSITSVRALALSAFAPKALPISPMPIAPSKTRKSKIATPSGAMSSPSALARMHWPSS